MTGGIPVSSIQSRYKRTREREVRALKLLVHLGQPGDGIPLFLVQMDQSLESEGWKQERRDDPNRVRLVSINQERDEGYVKRKRKGEQWPHISNKSKGASGSSQYESHDVKEPIKDEICNRCYWLGWRTPR